MRYVLILEDGELQVTGGGENAHHDDLGTTTPQRVPLAPLDGLPPITGWVSPSAATPNLLGGQTLINLGADPGDYFGPVCVTGWDEVDGIGINSDMSAVITAAYDAAVQQGD